MLPIYLVSLAFSAGMVGVYARRFLAMQGFVPSFESGVALAIAAACAFLTLELLYLGLLRLFVPGRSGSALLFEAISNFAAALLAPFLLGFSLLEKMGIGALDFSFADDLIEIEPVLLLGAFLALHTVLKLFALYAMVCANAESRLPAVAWLLGSGFTAYAAIAAAFVWHDDLLAAQVIDTQKMEYYQVGNTYAQARQLPEGAFLRIDLGRARERNMVLRWANLPDDARPLESIFVALRFPETEGEPQVVELPLDSNGWAEIRLAEADIPAGATTIEILWTSTKEPAWVLQTGLRPASGDGRPILLSGPWFHEPRTYTREPNVIVVMLEGAGAEHVSGFGYARDTTPSLSRLAANGLAYANAFSPAIDVKAVTMTLLTGLDPLSHHCLEQANGPLPEGVVTLPERLRDRDYATAAFSEGFGPDGADLVPGYGFERGFETLNDHYPVSVVWRRSQEVGANPVVPAGSEVTLERAGDWIEKHSAEKFMVFIRLRELRKPQWFRARYGDGFVTAPASPRPLNVYDTALRHVDKVVGEFYDRIAELPGVASNTLIAVVSPYGFDFNDGWSAEATRRLSEPCTHVPVVFSALGQKLQSRTDANAFVTLADAGVTLAMLAGVPFTHEVQGVDLVSEIAVREPISVAGNPLMLSIRTPRWRYTWQSGLEPFTLTPVEGMAPQPVELLDIDFYMRDWKQGNNIARNPQLMAGFEDQLRAYMKAQSGGPPVAATSRIQEDARAGTEAQVSDVATGRVGDGPSSL